MRIACIHQGYELYGSDRAFIESVAAIRGAFPAAEIEVVLPRGGPIVEPLSRIASRVVFEPLWILRRRDLPRLATVGLAVLPVAVARAARRIARCDLVYVNTTVIVDYLLAARLFPGKVVAHAHEIPEGAALPVLRGLLAWSAAELIFNSQATRTAFALAPGPTRHVVYNGISGPASVEPTTYDGSRPLRILTLGRISRIKGQEVLIEALDALAPDIKGRVEMRIVGSAFEDPEREAMLARMIAEKGLSAQVGMMPFADDPSPHYRWADIVAVPSRRPESLGRVAIEAMAWGRPPLASAIGGLREVVEDGKTGWLVAPDDVGALARALDAAVRQPDTWRAFVPQGRARFERLFSERAASDAIERILAGMLRRRRRPAPADASATAS